MKTHEARIFEQIVEAAGPQHPENWSKYNYEIYDIACEASAEIEQKSNEIEAYRSYLSKSEDTVEGLMSELTTYKLLEAAARAYWQADEHIPRIDAYNELMEILKSLQTKVMNDE